MTAPTIPDNAPDLAGMDAMERTIQSTMHEAKPLIGDDESISNRPRNDKGQFVSQSGEDPSLEPKGPGEWNTIDDSVPVEGQPPAEVQPPEGEAAKPVIPEGHVAAPPLDPSKVQGFKVLDAEGEIVAPDLKFEVSFKAGPRTLDLPQLVNYARMGVYNHERETQFDQGQRELHQWRTQVPRIEQAIRDQQARYERALSDPQFLASELERYDRENTPEARAERERQEIEQQREALKMEQMTHQADGFINNRLAPALERMAEMFPTVSREELASKLFLAAEPYRINGVLSPDHFQTVAAYVVHDLHPWAEQVHTDRDSRKAPAPPKEAVPVKDEKNKQLDAERVKNAKLRRIATAPRLVGGNQPQGTPAKQPPPSSNRGMEDFIVGRSVAGVQRSG